jgi:hypothetical protein
MSVNLFEERSEEPLNIRLKKMHRLWMLICFVAFLVEVSFFHHEQNHTHLI